VGEIVDTPVPVSIVLLLCANGTIEPVYPY
jgi:hypothetical protein